MCGAWGLAAEVQAELRGDVTGRDAHDGVGDGSDAPHGQHARGVQTPRDLQRECRRDKVTRHPVHIAPQLRIRVFP